MKIPRTRRHIGSLVAVLAAVAVACTVSPSPPGGGPTTTAPATTTTTTTVPPGPSSPPTGAHDASNDVITYGWAKDQDWAGPILVHVYVNDRLFDVALADGCRTDVGCHAYTVPHESFGSGQHNVKVFAIGVNANGVPDGQNPILTGGPVGGQEVFPATGNCNNVEPAARSWCTSVPQYWWGKLNGDTSVLSSLNLKTSVNRSYGGSIFELFGRDRSWNLIQENGGAAMQLSVWGKGAHGEETTQKGTPCAGWSVTSPFNPLQAQQAGCTWASSQDASNGVSAYQQNGDGSVRTEHVDPANFTGSALFSGMNMIQTTAIKSDAYLKVDYEVAVGPSPVPTDQPHPQELPALYLNLGQNPTVRYYGGSAPWTTGGVVQVSAVNQFLYMPGKPVVGSSKPDMGRLNEGWYSVCSSDNVHCVTIARLVNDPVAWWAEINTQAYEAGFSTYASEMSYFPISSNSNHKSTTYVFPYRYDQSVNGRTVRSWICSLNGKGC